MARASQRHGSRCPCVQARRTIAIGHARRPPPTARQSPGNATPPHARDGYVASQSAVRRSAARWSRCGDVAARGGLPGARQREDEGEAGEAWEEGAAHGLGSFRERGLWHRASVMERAARRGRYIAPACDGSAHVPRPAPQRVEIRGDVALVTGAAVGIGRAIATRLADEGAAVVVGDVDAGGGRETVRRIEASGGAARFVRADLTDAGEIRALVEAARTWHGTLGILVNNAGGGGHIPPHFPDAAPEQWGATLDLNLRAAMLATQLALTAMDGRGAVVNVSSSAGAEDTPYRSPEYAAAKAGLIRFTTALRRRDGVRVNCVVPGWIATERAQEELAAMPEAERAAAPDPIPMDVVAGAVVALIRDDGAAGRVVELREGA